MNLWCNSTHKDTKLLKARSPASLSQASDQSLKRLSQATHTPARLHLSPQPLHVPRVLFAANSVACSPSRGPDIHPPEACPDSSGSALAENMVFPKLGIILAFAVFHCS